MLGCILSPGLNYQPFGVGGVLLNALTFALDESPIVLGDRIPRVGYGASKFNSDPEFPSLIGCYPVLEWPGVHHGGGVG